VARIGGGLLLKFPPLLRLMLMLLLLLLLLALVGGCRTTETRQIRAQPIGHVGELASLPARPDAKGRPSRALVPAESSLSGVGISARRAASQRAASRARGESEGGAERRQGRPAGRLGAARIQRQPDECAKSNQRAGISPACSSSGGACVAPVGSPEELADFPVEGRPDRKGAPADSGGPPTVFPPSMRCSAALERGGCGKKLESRPKSQHFSSSDTSGHSLAHRRPVVSRWP